MSRDFGDFYPPSKPRAVDGGIKARSTRGAIAKTWWSERFIAVLEGMGMGGRLQRGRRYARAGQVVELNLGPGSVTATVQGSRPRPYRVRISVAAFDKGQWALLEQSLADKARYAAQLLAGEMPQDIEQVFADCGLPLFPARGRDLSMDCSCPDWEVPCKHLAAVCYLLAESFDDDPFRILAWRGRERADLLANLRALRTDGSVAADGPVARARPLADCLDNFYLAPEVGTAPAAPRLPVDSLLRQLPDVPVTVRGVALPELLRPAYLRMTRGVAGQ